MLMTIKWV